MKKNIRLLVLSNLWPSPYHTTRAANIVIFELLREFGSQKSIKTSFLKLNHPRDSKEISPEEKKGNYALREAGIEILEPLNLPLIKKPSKLRKVLKIFQPKLEDFYPEIIYQKIIEKRIFKFSPDIIFIPWSEWITVLCSGIKIPKFVYYGNPDPKVGLSRLYFSYKHGEVNFLKYLLLKNLFKKFKKIHLEIMKRYEILGDVAKNDADYYVKNGHSNAFYIQNLWIDRFGNSWWEKRRNFEKENPAIIIGNVGKLNGTANQYGLEVLGRDFLPELRKKMKGKNYEVHILGAGEFPPKLKKYFEFSEIKIRGFVNDIDKEILSAKVFLCLNSASVYKVGHTRYLHAWSLGSCVVAHQDSSLSMPEIVNGKNALLGKNIPEIADLIVKAIENQELRFKIGKNGHRTFQEYFTTEKVVPKILNKINEYFDKSSV